MIDPVIQRPPAAQGLVVISRSEEQTVMIGRAIGEALRKGDVVLLAGELGAGKTRMVHGMAAGVDSDVPARSPTFVIVNEYRGRLRLSHCDLFRVDSLGEVEELALEERLVDGALVVEWPERGAAALPVDSLLVQIEVDHETGIRTMIITAGGDRSAHLASRAATIYEALEMVAGMTSEQTP